MKSKPKRADADDLVMSWDLSYAATLGSSMRKKGIFLEVRARLPAAHRHFLKLGTGILTLRTPADCAGEFHAASAIASHAMATIGDLPVLPREIEDILGISATERHRWLKDGRLPSAGTRTVALPGRAKKITFHFFDRRVVEDVLDRDLVSNWREDDALAAAENGRRAAWKAQLTRSQQSTTRPRRSTELDEGDPSLLRGWAAFERDGPR